MSKEQVIADAKALLAAAEDQAFGQVYDQAQAEMPSGGGGFTQADIDAAVAAAVQPLSDQILGLQAQVQADADKDVQDEAKIKELGDALVAAQSLLAEKQAEFDALALKEGEESAALKTVREGLEKYKQIVAILESLQPAPAPQPEPQPEV